MAVGIVSIPGTLQGPREFKYQPRPWSPRHGLGLEGLGHCPSLLPTPKPRTLVEVFPWGRRRFIHNDVSNIDA